MLEGMIVSETDPSYVATEGGHAKVDEHRDEVKPAGLFRSYQSRRLKHPSTV